jgi:hypothetical protein
MNVPLQKTFPFPTLNGAPLIGLSLSQHHVCLKYKYGDDTIDIICSVDKLIHQIVFKNPAGKENGE